MKRLTKNAGRKRRNGFERLMVQIGIMVVHSLLAVWGVIWAIVRGVFQMVWYSLRQIGRIFRALGRSVRNAFAEHNRAAQEMLLEVRHAKKDGGKQFVKQVIRFIGLYIFGEHGILRTGFNYLIPVLSIAFLIAIVQYGTGLDYAISVVCNGEELGIISSESEFEAAEAEVRQRVGTDGEGVSFNPVYTLKIVSENDQYVSSRTLADKLLAGSQETLEEATGVYVDGEFIGAVTDVKKISDTMDKNLSDYATNLNDLVSEVYYTKSIEYQEGIYLADSVKQPQEILKILTAEEETESRYTIQSGDSPQLVAAKFNMTLEELQELNPHMERSFSEGSMLKVRTVSRYIPIAYTKNLTVTSFIDYASVEVETSALNLGERKVVAKGVMGEKSSEVEVTVIDGVESERRILSSAVTKEPVPEQIGIGTYSPEPASKETVFRGNGMFGWPVDGGYISDGYISDRNHKGIDIAAPYGSDIYASEAGFVVTAGWNSGGYGYYVIIEHADGYRTLYAHCSVVIAYEGQTVEKGQVIAKVGSTGNSTGNHCHYEVRLNNICVDPGHYLRVNAD